MTFQETAIRAARAVVARSAKLSFHLVKTSVQSLLVSKKSYLKKTFALPLLGLLAFTGCASVHGTSDNNDPANNQVANYIDQKDSSTISCCR